jgi:mycothione reductase
MEPDVFGQPLRAQFEAFLDEHRADLNRCLDGLTEAEARASGRDVLVGSRPYSATAYGWALEDTTSFLKVIVDAQDRTIVGAHVIGPDAALLLQPLLQAMMLGQTADQVARDVLYIHPALTEVVEQALLEL